MTISIVNFKKYLQKIKDDIENYKLNEAEIYLKLLKSKFNIPKRTEYYLNGKIATLKNDYDQAIECFKKIDQGVFYYQSRYQLSKLFLIKNNFDHGDKYFISRLSRGKKIDRKLYYENKLNIPIWNFENNCKVILWQDFSIGETILFLRLMHFFKPYHQINFTIFIDPRLIPFFNVYFPEFSFVDYNIQPEISKYDFQFPIGSLIKILDNKSINKIKEIPSLKIESVLPQDENLISLFVSSHEMKNHIHKSINFEILLKILEPLRNTCRFQIINYTNSRGVLEELLITNNFKIKKIEKDIFHNLENLAQTLLASKLSLMTSCTESYISSFLGIKSVILYNKSFTSNWMWHHCNSDYKNIWFQNLYCFPFVRQDQKISFDLFPDLLKIISVK